VAKLLFHPAGNERLAVDTKHLRRLAQAGVIHLIGHIINERAEEVKNHCIIPPVHTGSFHNA